MICEERAKLFSLPPTPDTLHLAVGSHSPRDRPEVAQALPNVSRVLALFSRGSAPRAIIGAWESVHYFTVDMVPTSASRWVMIGPGWWAVAMQRSGSSCATTAYTMCAPGLQRS